MAEPLLPYLPEDIIVDNILVRVPVKLVGRFRCVSKPWRSLLSTPKFARAHLNFHTDNEPEGTILTEQTVDHAFWSVNLADESSDVFKKVTIPPSSPDVRMIDFFLSDSCHGLVLVRQISESEVWSLNLFNPITLETQKIPDPGCSTCALGYDNSEDDYKIVCVSIPLQNVSIYSVKMKTWRSIGYVRRHVRGFGCFLNGCIHCFNWSHLEGRMILTAFSLAREEFEELPPPKGCKSGWITLLGGCLALVSLGRECVDFWVMKEYGVEDSWTKYSVTIPAMLRCDACYDLQFSCGVWVGDEIVFSKGAREELVVYNWRTGVWRNMVNTGIPPTRFHGKTNFRESLISPNYV